MSTAARTSSENVISRFGSHLLITQSHSACKMCSNCPGIKLEQRLSSDFFPGKGSCDTGYWGIRRQNWTFVILWSRRPLNWKHVISRRGKNENVFKMSKDEKCTCEACKNTVFHCQISKFVMFLLPSSSWLHKLPNYRWRTLRGSHTPNFLSIGSSNTWFSGINILYRLLP